MKSIRSQIVPDVLRVEKAERALSPFGAAYLAGGQAVVDDTAFWQIALMPTSTKEERKARHKALAAHRHSLSARRADLDDRRTAIESNLHQAGLEESRLQRIVEWHERPFVLEPCEVSRLHDLRSALKHGKWDLLASDKVKKECERFWPDEFKQPPHTFLIQNDWAAPFANATDFDGGDFRLPYDVCCFEFQISGRHFIVHLQQVGDAILVSPFMDADDGRYWFLLGSACPFAEIAESMIDAAPILSAQIRAVCIALDAEVAVSEQIHAPYAENRSRAKQGLPPLLAHHTISLSKRTRSSKLSGEGGSHRSPRLHFRRGHWRHFATHKTWIRWMLVGDPDLGFVDKKYRL